MLSAERHPLQPYRPGRGGLDREGVGGLPHRSAPDLDALGITKILLVCSCARVLVVCSLKHIQQSGVAC